MLEWGEWSVVKAGALVFLGLWVSRSLPEPLQLIPVHLCEEVHLFLTAVFCDFF